MYKKKAHPDKERQGSPALRGRIWIDGPEGTFLGYGRIVLLERIGEHGSITKAAKSMSMSYRHAWELVDSMNRQAGTHLVESAAGGKGGGGARLTGEGRKAVGLFWKLYGDFQDFLRREEQILELLFPQAGPMIAKGDGARMTGRRRKQELDRESLDSKGLAKSRHGRQ